MNVTLKLYATLSDYLPEQARKTNQIALEVASTTTIGQLIESYHLPPRLVHLVLVNGHYVAPGVRARRMLCEGDVLAVWPPIAGG